MRDKSARRDEDREFATDTEAVATLIEQGSFARFVPDLLSDLGCQVKTQPCAVAPHPISGSSPGA